MDKKRLYTIFAIIFTNIFGAMMILPVLALYAVNNFGATIQQATLLSTAYFAAQFLAAPRLGRLSDRFGRRPLLIISQIGTVFSFILFIFAPQLGSWLDNIGLTLAISGGLFVMFIARTLDGITGGNITIAQAYVADLSSSKTRTEALGLLTGAFGSGFIFGPAVGGLLARLGPAAPFIGATVVTTITLIMTTILLDESLPPEKRSQPGQKKQQVSLWQALKNRTFATILAIGFVQSLAFSALPATFSLYAERVLFPGLDIQTVSSNVGLMMAYMGIVTVVTQTVLIKRIVHRIGERNMVWIGMLCMMAAMLTLPWFLNVIFVTLLFTPWSFGRGLLQPSLQSLASKQAAPQHRGRYLGIYQSALSLALIFGPIYSGWVFDTFSPQTVLLVGAGVMLPGVGLALVLKRMLGSTSGVEA